MAKVSAVYECEVCGYIFDQRAEDESWDELDDFWTCPQCHAPRSVFTRLN